MPSPVGHALAGFSIGIVAQSLPAASGASLRIPLLAGFIAASPDLDLLIPHFHRTATHSLAATVFLIILTATVTGKVTGRIGWRVPLILGAAHASHVLLDWLGTDPFAPSGIQIFWPFNREFLISDWNFFPPTERRLLANPNALAINARALITELATLGLITGLVWFVRRRRRSRGRTSGQDGLRPPSAAAADTAGTSDRRAHPASQQG